MTSGLLLGRVADRLPWARGGLVDRLPGVVYGGQGQVADNTSKSTQECRYQHTTHSTYRDTGKGEEDKLKTKY